MDIGFTKRNKPVTSCIVIQDDNISDEPRRGAVEVYIMDCVELFMAEGGEAPDLEAVVLMVKKRMPVKSGVKDQRRKTIKRALENLIDKDELALKHGKYLPVTPDLSQGVHEVHKGTNGINVPP